MRSTFAIGSVGLAIAACCFIDTAAAHSWVISAGGGIKRGGLLINDDTDNQRYYCPTASLAACQPDQRQTLVLTAANQRACLPGLSPTMGKGTAGQPLKIEWAGNGHANAQSDGTCVHVRIAKYASDPNDSDFQTIASCLPYHINSNPGGTVTLPSNLATGRYTLHWYWDFATFWYTSCVDLDVTGSGSGSSSSKGTTATQETAASSGSSRSGTTKAPAPTPALRGSSSSGSSSKKNSSPPKTASSSGPTSETRYRQEGCRPLDDGFCASRRVGSYCKPELEDNCGRSVCLNDDESALVKCPL